MRVCNIWVGSIFDFSASTADSARKRTGEFKETFLELKFTTNAVRPSHKLSCGVEPVNGTFQKILHRFLTNPFLYIVFRMLTIYKHQLYLMKEDALNALRSKPFGLELFIQFEPADAKVLLKSVSTLASKKLSLTIGSDKANEAVVAIPQIVAVSVIPEQEITRMEFTKWKGALVKAAGRSRDGKPPLQAVLRVSQWYGGEKTPAIKINTITTSLVIPDDSLRFARGQSLPLISALPYPVGQPCQDIAKLVEYVFYICTQCLSTQ